MKPETNEITLHTRSSPALVIILVGLILLFLNAMLIYQNRKLQQELTQLKSPPANQITITPYSQPTSTASPIDQTANWKTYTNSKYGFVVEYNPNSPPEEVAGNTDDGQFAYLFKVEFGTNPLKSVYGYEVRVTTQRDIASFREELIGHITDRIDTEKQLVFNKIAWLKINYQISLVTDKVPMTMAITNHKGYSFIVTSSTLDIDQILATFKFTNTKEKETTYTLFKDLAKWQIEEDVSQNPYPYVGSCADGQRHNPAFKVFSAYLGRGNPDTVPGWEYLFQTVQKRLTQNGWQRCTEPAGISNPDGTLPNETYRKNGKLFYLRKSGSMGVGYTVVVLFEYNN